MSDVSRFFKGKTAIVTGGASGIGRALVEHLGASGCRTAILDLNEDAAREVAEALRARGLDVTSACVDMRDRAAFDSVFDRTASALGHVDFFFSIAGINVFGEARDYDFAVWKDVVDTNLYGVIHGVAACYPLMIRQGHGHIINMASLAALLPSPASVAYTAAKCGVWGLSLALRCEAAPLGVRVSVACPAAVDTPIIQRSRFLNLDRDRFVKSVPGRPLSPAECAQAILRGVVRNEAVITPGVARWIGLVARYMPWLGRWIAAQILKAVASNRKATIEETTRGR